MSKRVLGAIVVALAAGSAHAADLPYRQPYSAPPAAYAVYSWVGPYIGLNLGYQWGGTTNNPTDPSGIMGGVQAGYNFQFNQFVVGVETDIQLSGAEDTFAPTRHTRSPAPTTGSNRTSSASA